MWRTLPRRNSSRRATYCHEAAPGHQQIMEPLVFNNQAGMISRIFHRLPNFVDGTFYHQDLHFLLATQSTPMLCLRWAAYSISPCIASHVPAIELYSANVEIAIQTMACTRSQHALLLLVFVPESLSCSTS